ncbi:hypothetical protein [Pseudomonas oryzihabitans]|uniref:hypothetical protein n=1 Tax=Pseudomonas oryzihabitans TaxID=47885 RepID=UPI000737353F|nr:hypothetical protein [Pseudomonas psychrotolerans]KTT50823.1 hypothetical protein NS337_18030 [Pseudomonas psychrotolerans]
MTQTTQERLQNLEEQIRSHRQDLARSRQSFQEQFVIYTRQFARLSVLEAQLELVRRNTKTPS